MRSRDHVVNDIVEALHAANGRRRVRTLSTVDVLHTVCMAAIRKSYRVDGGGTVANAYRYPAVQTVCTAICRRGGDVVLLVGTNNATRGSAKRPASWKDSIHRVWAQSDAAHNTIYKSLNEWACKQKSPAKIGSDSMLILERAEVDQLVAADTTKELLPNGES
jgi:hypothetical protein